MIYHAVVSKQVLRMKYRSFKARSASSFLFYPYFTERVPESLVHVRGETGNIRA